MALLEEHRRITRAEIASELDRVCQRNRFVGGKLVGKSRQSRPSKYLGSEKSFEAKRNSELINFGFFNSSATAGMPSATLTGHESQFGSTASRLPLDTSDDPSQVRISTVEVSNHGEIEEYIQEYIQELEDPTPAPCSSISEKIRKWTSGKTATERISNVVKALKNRPTESRNRASVLTRMVTSQDPDTAKLDIIITVVILASVIVMMIELQYQSYTSQVMLGMIPDDGSWEDAKMWFDIVEHCFNVAFLVEIGIRFNLFGCAYFKRTLNNIDFILVLLTSVQLYVLDPMRVARGGNLTIFRLLRFVRFIRILKIMRLKMFTELRVLVKTCISSMGALGWSMVLLFVIIIMSGLFLCNLLKGVIQDPSGDMVLRKWLFNHYGSSFRASYTLFEVTMAGCWPQYFRPLIEQVSGYYSIFAVVYISIVVFAVIRIITAIFLKQTLQVAGNDADMVVIEQKAKMQQCIEKLAACFEAIDTTGEGLIYFDQFKAIINNADVKAWLQTLDMHVHDVEALFHLLDDGDGAITYDEFLPGMLRLKGQARSLDLVALSRHCDKIEETVLLIERKVDKLVKAFGVASSASSVFQ